MYGCLVFNLNPASDRAYMAQALDLYSDIKINILHPVRTITCKI